MSSLSFASIPDVCWRLISSFAAPPDVYNLALSSKHFFQSGDEILVFEVGAKVMICNIQSMPDLNGRSGIIVDATKEKEQVASGRIPVLIAGMSKSIALKPSCVTSPLLATTLLRESLLSSLGRALEHSKSGITLKSVLKLPEGSLIAGSTMAQACLGVLWEKGSRESRKRNACLSDFAPTHKPGDIGCDDKVDVDVYCSARAAPQVRSWLVEQASCMFIGFKEPYLIDNIAHPRLVFTIDTKFHHVEHWGSIIENLQRSEEEDRMGLATEVDFDCNDAAMDLRETDYYKERTRWGQNVQKNYVDWKWKYSIDELGVGRNVLDRDRDSRAPSGDKTYDIKPKPGGDLPFDFNGEGNIDLIVARKKEGGEKEITPFNLLDDFDLTICKASFDGKTFHIPDPHRTFSGQSTMEPNRRAIVESYVRHFPPGQSKRYLDLMTESAVASNTIKKVRKDVPNTPFYKQLDIADGLPDRYNPNWQSEFGHPLQPHFGRGPLDMDPMVQVKYGSPVLFHNWTVKLINRLRKYQHRGIEVIDAPTIGDDVQISEICWAEY